MKNTPKQEGGKWSMGSSSLGRNYLGYKGQAVYVGSCCWYFLCSYFPDGTSFLGWVLSGQHGFLKWIALAQWVGWLQAPALGLTQQSRDCFIDHSGLGSRMRSEWDLSFSYWSGAEHLVTCLSALAFFPGRWERKVDQRYLTVLGCLGGIRAVRATMWQHLERSSSSNLVICWGDVIEATRVFCATSCRSQTFSDPQAVYGTKRQILPSQSWLSFFQMCPSLGGLLWWCWPLVTGHILYVLKMTGFLFCAWGIFPRLG